MALPVNYKDVLLGLMGAALLTAFAFGWWHDRQVRRLFNQVTDHADSVIAARRDTIQALKYELDSLRIKAAESKVIYLKGKDHWDTVRVEIDRPDLSLEEARVLLKQADSTVTACSVAFTDCEDTQRILLNKAKLDSLLVEDLERRLKIEKQKPTGSSWTEKLLWASLGATAGGVVCELAK